MWSYGCRTCQGTHRERPQQFSAPGLDSCQVLTLIPTNNHTRNVVMLGGSIDEFVEILHNV
jgi:hypothetical protein